MRDGDHIRTSISVSGNDKFQLKLSEILKKSQLWIWGEGSKFQVILFEAPIRTFQLVTVYHKWLVNDRSLPGLLTIPCNFYVIPGNQIEQQSCFNPLITHCHPSPSSIRMSTLSGLAPAGSFLGCHRDRTMSTCCYGPTLVVLCPFSMKKVIAIKPTWRNYLHIAILLGILMAVSWDKIIPYIATRCHDRHVEFPQQDWYQRELSHSNANSATAKIWFSSQDVWVPNNDTKKNGTLNAATWLIPMIGVASPCP